MFGITDKRWLVAILALATAYCLLEAKGEGDLYIYLSAAGLLDEQGDIFLKAYINGQYHYYYSVLFALIIKPFYSLPYYPVKFFWLMLNMGLFLFLFDLLCKVTAIKNMERNKKWLFLGGSFIFSLRFLHENIHASQITIIIFFCCIYGLILIARGKNMRGSAFLAIGINIKLLPLVFIPYLFYRGYFKALSFTIFWLLVYFAIPSIFIGHEYHVQLIKSWAQLINPSDTRHVLDVDERSFHGISTLLATLFVEKVPDYYALPLKRNVADISVDQLFQLLLVVRLFLISFTIWFISSLPFKKANSVWQYRSEIAYILLLIPLIFPHQQHYAFLFICPAFCLVFFHLVNHWYNLRRVTRTLLSIVIVLIYLTVNLKLLLGAANRYYEHYKILTYGALLLIPVLAWVYLKFKQIDTSQTTLD